MALCHKVMESLEPTIIYEDDAVLAINKPAGLVVHHDGRTDEFAVTDWVVRQYPFMGTVGEPFVLKNGEVINRAGVVHRIDRETSGVLLLAKTEDSFRSLKEQFQERNVVKHYNAFIYGTPQEQKGQINLPIGRSTRDFRLWTAGKNVRGHTREAVTEYEVLSHNEKSSFLAITPQTGRTHQIRVHLKAIGHPVVCDKRYAPERECILGFERVALHARSILIKTLSGSTLSVEAPFPPDFERALVAITV